MERISVIGIDLAKDIFQIHGAADVQGQAVFRKRLRRSQLTLFMRELSPCLVGMEACSGSHHWARVFEEMGHTVKIMPAQYVKPYVKTNKNDMIDAEAICEAVTRPNMRFVPIKRIEQQDMLVMHRIRERWVKQRTALINQMRGLLTEYGVVLPRQRQRFQVGLPQVLADEDNGLSPTLRQWTQKLWEEYVQIAERLQEVEQDIAKRGKAKDAVRRLLEIPGVGILTATAMEASLGDAKDFKNGRQVSAWLGIVPKQNSSGGKTRLGRISKRGDGYLRRLLVHGARSVLARAANKEDARSRWVLGVQERGGTNKACVALANKNARMIWALIAHQDRYRSAEQMILES